MSSSAGRAVSGLVGEADAEEVGHEVEHLGAEVDRARQRGRRRHHLRRVVDRQGRIGQLLLHLVDRGDGRLLGLDVGAAAVDVGGRPAGGQQLVEPVDRRVGAQAVDHRLGRSSTPPSRRRPSTSRSSDGSRPKSRTATVAPAQ